MTFLVSVGKWGGIYFYRGTGFRLCLGFIAFTYFPFDGDKILAAAAQFCEMTGTKAEIALDTNPEM